MCLSRILNKTLGKQSQRSNWEQPLTPAQQAYAAADAAVTLDLWDALLPMQVPEGADVLLHDPGAEAALQALETERLATLRDALRSYAMVHTDGVPIDQAARLRHVKPATILEHLSDVCARAPPRPPHQPTHTPAD